MIRFHSELMLIELFLSLHTIIKCGAHDAKIMKISEMQINDQRRQCTNHKD